MPQSKILHRAATITVYLIISLVISAESDFLKGQLLFVNLSSGLKDSDSNSHSRQYTYALSQNLEVIERDLFNKFICDRWLYHIDHYFVDTILN